MQCYRRRDFGLAHFVVCRCVAIGRQLFGRIYLSAMASVGPCVVLPECNPRSDPKLEHLSGNWSSRAKMSPAQVTCQPFQSAL
jgi:hypothetical protein